MTFQRTYTHRIEVFNTSGTRGFVFPTNSWDPVMYNFAFQNPGKANSELTITPTVLHTIVTSYYARSSVDFALVSVKVWGPTREDVPIRVHFSPNDQDPGISIMGSDVGTATNRPKVGVTSPILFWLDNTSATKDLAVASVQWDTTHLTEDFSTRTLILGYVDVTIATRNSLGKLTVQPYHHVTMSGVPILTPYGHDADIDAKYKGCTSWKTKDKVCKA